MSSRELIELRISILRGTLPLALVDELEGMISKQSCVSNIESFGEDTGSLD